MKKLETLIEFSNLHTPDLLAIPSESGWPVLTKMVCQAFNRAKDNACLAIDVKRQDRDVLTNVPLTDALVDIWLVETESFPSAKRPHSQSHQNLRNALLLKFVCSEGSCMYVCLIYNTPRTTKVNLQESHQSAFLQINITHHNLVCRFMITILILDLFVNLFQACFSLTN